MRFVLDIWAVVHIRRVSSCYVRVINRNEVNSSDTIIMTLIVHLIEYCPFVFILLSKHAM